MHDGMHLVCNQVNFNQVIMYQSDNYMHVNFPLGFILKYSPTNI